WQLSGLLPDAINTYLVGDVLIDAGTRWSAGKILRHLRGRRLGLLALTHCHPDHQGSAAEICRRRRIPLACHEADADAMEGRSPMVPSNPVLGIGKLLWSGPPHPVDQRLRGGEVIAGFRILHAPGHTPGHVVLFRDSDRVAIVGDVLRNLNYLRGTAQFGE